MAKRNNLIEQNRRDFLRLLGLSGVGGILGNLGIFLPSSARAQGVPRKPFIVAIGMGSWDGYASGLWQAHDVGVYPKGAFVHNSNEGSVNPLINRHFKSGNIIFNNYSNVLQSVATELCSGTTLARSLQHSIAMSYQLGGQATNAGFLSGAAQVFLNNLNPNGVGIISSSGYSSRLNGKTTAVANVPGNNVTAMRDTYQDAAGLPKNANLNKIWSVHKTLTQAPGIVSSGVDVTKLQIDTFEAAIHGGIPPDIASGSPLIVEVDAAITQAKVDAKIDAYITDAYDGAACKARFTEQKTVFDKLKLAAILAKSGLAYGVDMITDNQDYHSQDSSGRFSSTHTAQSAAMVYAMVSVFWDWVKANNMQDDVLIILTHEFGRTAYNTGTGVSQNVIVNNQTVAVPFRGNDHGTGAGYFFINGKLPAGMRYGSMGDNASVFGSKSDGKGLPDSTIKAYTSSDLVGSVLLKIWGDKFIDKTFMRQFWSDFTTEVGGLI